MANVTPRKNKDGEIISFRVRVSRGYDAQGKKLKPFETSWRPDPAKTEKQNQKALDAFVHEFEMLCKAGLAADSRQKFQTYAEYCLDLWERNQTLKAGTLDIYIRRSIRVFAGIGHIKLFELKPQHLNAFYEQLMQSGIRTGKDKAVIRPDVDLKAIAGSVIPAGISAGTFQKACKGVTISAESAGKIAAALECSAADLFSIQTDDRPLSASTVKGYHTFISAVLHQAVCEQLIPANPADRATLPKMTDKKEVGTYTPEQLAAILQAAESQPLKWKTLIHLLLATGCRRGEIIGLTWNAVDWTHNRIHIEQTVSYNKQRGVYVDSTKTAKAVRWIQLPPQTAQLLHEYREQYYKPLKSAAGKNWNADSDFIFVQDSGEHIGSVMHPHSVNKYLTAFSASHDLPHIHPHKFRHSAASMLFYAGVDAVSIAGLLGHSSPTITESLYAHFIADIQSRAAQCIGNQIYMTTNAKQNEQSDVQQEQQPTEKTG